MAGPRAVPYGWPVEPFDRQHPVRGYFSDPRDGEKRSTFHFGIDVAVPDGTPVFSVEAGTALRVHAGGVDPLDPGSAAATLV